MLLAGCVVGAVRTETAVTAAAVNVRSGPGSEFPVLTSVPGGATLTVFGCFDDRPWCDVSSGNARGWVSSEYLDGLTAPNKAKYPPVPVWFAFGQ